DPEIQSAITAAPAASRWPEQNYILLRDVGKMTVKPDGTVVSEYRVIYKLFNERARGLAEVNIPYNASYESVHVIHARTIQKSGRLIDVKPGDMRTGSTYSDYPL